MRIAVVADIHGNLRALEAVVADLRDAAPDLVVNLGDSASGPLEAADTIDRLDDLGWPTVRGNHDRYLLEGDDDLGDWDADALPQLGKRQLAWLALLPPTLVIDDILLCHGAPRSDETYLLEHVSGHAMVLRPQFEVRAMLSTVSETIVLCGHTHVPRLFSVPGGPTVINPGSVGIQAYADDMPSPHVMETGSPHARYAILDRRRDGFRVEFRALDYDWNAAADVARDRGRLDWAHALVTGTANR
ncbi:metallophosphoesterase family protein [Chthonobacter rhizosphaerae]|uniref:metallophosphoesterase family protein n=1 Tax=Chthonobacter rhizosphaerae TaxID=2735553 RepID=UPI0015EE6B71|nr:metallophosphoesterase family protein [Chthonobacter rhizosphaerae]